MRSFKSKLAEASHLESPESNGRVKKALELYGNIMS